MLRILSGFFLCIGAVAAQDVHVESSADAGAHQGRIRAVVERPFAQVAAALSQPANWCEILTLQVNIKRCRVGDGATLTAFVTRRPRDPVDSARGVEFRFQPARAGADRLHVEIGAESGPMGTRDYRIVVDAAPLDAGRTTLRMSYAYTLGWAARMAMDAYLAGAGRDKRGFTVDGGERAIAERGAMRHYLAIEAYLGSQRDLEPRLRRWYAAIDRHPQLREAVSAEEYVEMKRREAG